MKKIVILGSTGSIGTQTLEVVRTNQDIQVTGLAARGNIELLERQVREFHPKIVCVWEQEKAKELRIKLKDLDISIVSGMDGLVDIATEAACDIVVTAVVGMIGVQPTIAAIKAGKHIALANKETLVTAGHLIMPLAKEYHVNILPVDSEHSAIFQALNGEDKKQIERILLTASGGPFRGYSKEQLSSVTLKEALKHPNWSMGKKITIDSATMVNKGLEVIEAKWLFDVSPEQIEVVVQPQSIIHSMVEFKDGSIIAQLGTPDMRLPIQYALYYPERRYLPGERLDFHKLRTIAIETPDQEVFRGLALAYQSLKIGKTMPVVYNAANEWAVSKFLKKEISFLMIQELIEWAMEKHNPLKEPSLKEILETERETQLQLEAYLQAK